MSTTYRLEVDDFHILPKTLPNGRIRPDRTRCATSGWSGSDFRFQAYIVQNAGSASHLEVKSFVYDQVRRRFESFPFTPDIMAEIWQILAQFFAIESAKVYARKEGRN